MKNRILFIIPMLSLLASCQKEDDFVMPTFYEREDCFIILQKSFENTMAEEQIIFERGEHQSLLKIGKDVSSSEKKEKDFLFQSERSIMGLTDLDKDADSLRLHYQDDNRQLFEIEGENKTDKYEGKESFSFDLYNETVFYDFSQASHSKEQMDGYLSLLSLAGVIDMEGSYFPSKGKYSDSSISQISSTIGLLPYILQTSSRDFIMYGFEDRYKENPELFSIEEIDEGYDLTFSIKDKEELIRFSYSLSSAIFSSYGKDTITIPLGKDSITLRKDAVDEVIDSKIEDIETIDMKLNFKYELEGLSSISYSIDATFNKEFYVFYGFSGSGIEDESYIESISTSSTWIRDIESTHFADINPDDYEDFVPPKIIVEDEG